MSSHRSAHAVCVVGLVLAACDGDPASPVTADGGGDSATGEPSNASVDGGLGRAPDATADAPQLGCSSDTGCDDFNPCNGAERCRQGRCLEGEPADDGTRCDLDHNPGTADVCLSGRCQASRCGDRWVDSEAGEQCDDANHDPGDGCSACRYGCEDDSDCGQCSECHEERHRCVPLPEGESCADEGSCEGGVCLAKRCETDAGCDDGNPCNGAEMCRGGSCVLGEAPDCSDADPCTEDVCDPSAGGCVHYLWDFDLDGHAPADLGDCGTDCDDEHAGVHPGAPESCDGLDNDCDGRVDEGGLTTWWVDCDGDGYAAAGAVSAMSCGPPSPLDTGCGRPGAEWTSRSPSFGPSTDCNDRDERVNPGQTTYQTKPIEGAEEGAEFDYNCDGVEDTILTTEQSSCTMEGSGCAMEPGWLVRRDCGESGFMLARCRQVLLPYGKVGCMEVPETTVHVQRCL